MARHVFLSFVGDDLDAVNLFRGQARNQNSELAFDDYSVKEPYNSANAAYIRAQIADRIRAASVTLCLIGQATYLSEWVDWEIKKSIELGNRVVGVQLYKDAVCPVPRALSEAAARVVGWDVAAIVKAIS
jgi:hypothetical protein